MFYAKFLAISRNNTSHQHWAAYHLISLETWIPQEFFFSRQYNKYYLLQENPCEINFLRDFQTPGCPMSAIKQKSFSFAASLH